MRRKFSLKLEASLETDQEQKEKAPMQSYAKYFEKN